jgi:hypothetical protein
MKMKIIMIAALVAVQLPATVSPTQAAELPSGSSMERTDPADGRSRAGIAEVAEINLGDAQAQVLRAGSAAESSQEATAREDRSRKRKSTGDKVLTGAAVILGVGALAVGGLLVAIFVG